MKGRALDWDGATTTPQPDGTDYLVPLSGDGSVRWTYAWSVALGDVYKKWTRDGAPHYAALTRSHEVLIRCVRDADIGTVRADLTAAIEQANRRAKRS